MKVDVIKKYFQSWLDNDVEIVKQTFSENALYSECYGPEYHGLSQIFCFARGYKLVFCKFFLLHLFSYIILSVTIHSSRGFYEWLV